MGIWNDPVVKAIEQGKDTKGWDRGKDATEPDDSEERAERLARLAELEEDE